MQEETKKITQQDLDNSTLLREQGFQVGDDFPVEESAENAENAEEGIDGPTGPEGENFGAGEGYTGPVEGSSENNSDPVSEDGTPKKNEDEQ